ncbi:MAG: copper resistance protein CopC, partial [Actinomycetota bacterium]|nr:copper resistance protein CopC [Actinomycetota bacterium]
GPTTGPTAGGACRTGSPSAVGVRPTSSMGGTDVPVPAAAGAVAVAVGLLLAAGRGRLWRDRQ